MNVIVVLLDSLNFDCLEPYGSTQVHTPNLARLAPRALSFDNHFIGSAPCIPARRDLFTGRREFLWRGWGHIEPWDRHLAGDAEKCGYVTQMITDHYHYWENGAHGYFEPFQGVDFIRGHEFDMWDTAPMTNLPEWVRSIDRHRDSASRSSPGWGSRFYKSARNYEGDESLFPCAQVMQGSADWLDRNAAHEKFFLWTEALDPHEPHFLPEPYRTMYSPDGKDHPELTCWPPYQNANQTRRFLEQTSDFEIEWVRSQYHGKVTMVDHWLGRLLDRMDALDLWKSTTLIVTTDHGHELCANRALLSPYGKSYPHREAHSRIPLMICHPEVAGGTRVDALTTTVDICSTVRDLCGDPEPDGPDGRSLIPLLRGETATHRDHVLFGDFETGVCLATNEWILAQGCRAERPLFWYSSTATVVSPEMTAGHFIPGVEIPQWRIPWQSADCPSFLWTRQPYSPEPEDVLERKPEVARQMRRSLVAALEAAPSPPEFIAGLDLNPCHS